MVAPQDTRDVNRPEDLRVDGILRLIEEARRNRPVQAVLTQLCQEVSVIMGANVVSVYLREEDELVMTANVGLSDEAVGTVRLKVGEGIVGLVAETLHPAWFDFGPGESRFKPIRGIGEEHFPCYAAVPLFFHRENHGVVVLQRENTPFTEQDVVLATALATPFSFALHAAEARTQDTPPPSRYVRLNGNGISPGIGIGRIETLPSFDGLAQHFAEKAYDAEQLDDAIVAVQRDLERALRPYPLEHPGARALSTLAFTLDDKRFRELIHEQCSAKGYSDGLREVARTYARHALPTDAAAPSEDDFLVNRATDMGDICLLIAMGVCDIPFLRAGSMLVVPEGLSRTMALIAVARRCPGVVSAGPVASDGPVASLLRDAEIPFVAGTEGVFAWARNDDRILVDGASGTVRINPPPVDIVRARRSERPQSQDRPPHG